MAKIRAMGDSVQLKSELTAKEIERVKTYCPEALKLKDEEGNEFFGIGLGDASVSRYGVTFANTDVDGKVFVTMENPITDHSDAEVEKAALTAYFAVSLDNLNKVEDNINTVRALLDEKEAKAADSIEVIA